MEGALNSRDMLVVFDFDCTIAEVDSDLWVAEQLGAKPLMEQLRLRLPWNEMMDTLMGALHAEGKSIAEVGDALRSIPLQSDKIVAIKLAHAIGCELRIVSDANSFFIETILDKYGVTSLFSHIHTNPASIDDLGRLRISPFHSKSEAPHACQHCPPNMCKGRIIEKIQSEMLLSKRVIYVGDGCGDYCPTLRLREGDFVLPRKEYPLWEMLNEKSAHVRAAVHPWATGAEMKVLLMNLINGSARMEEEQPPADISDVNCATIALVHREQSRDVSSVKAVPA
ncbi:hypothetical protein KP509_24G021100 [Ceratopteris richardii]|uniref:Uncharacterized protein n=1 Tax=Ceratopteris richardii TaxID=49495 RepID=A0A8T2RSZ9_CERRI|nr:hypothetical protein KP509_24G021100 [Ceratopteris richardii]